jgi:hypothetical protein
LLAFEQLQAFKVTLWGAACVVAGTVLVAVASSRRERSSLLFHFGVQNALWGALAVAIALWWRSSLPLRDLQGAIALDRLTWFLVGLSVGAVALGAALVVLGFFWRSGPRAGIVGAGIAVVVQGLAFTVLQLQFSTTVVR